MQLQEFSDVKCFIAPQSGGALIQRKIKIQENVMCQNTFSDKNQKIKTNLVTGAARQKLKQAFLLSARSSSAARKQDTAPM